ncbi:MAG TPA: hypothetical protein VNI02_08880 [Blastocatellia bacterium]|jgi:hypothetical protein|nr:hypothetical protein [Blastocatellia bacterium]
MADDDRETCDHSICNCTVTDDDSDYCSAYCETAGDSTELACNCGHPGCAAAL